MDTESLRARVLDAYQHGPEAVVALVATLMSELAGHLEAMAARVTALEEENATLRAKLETTSRNSGKPPSSDGPGGTPHRAARPTPRATGRPVDVRPVVNRGTRGRACGWGTRPTRCRRMRPVAVRAVGRTWRTLRCGGRSGGR